MPTFVPQPAQPQGNFMASLKDFVARGGNVNGLNPAITGRIWYVNANSETDRGERKGPIGSDSNSGRTPNNPFATVARAFEFVDCYDIIVLDGVIREQVVAPLGVLDVTIIGAANRPRQATNSGVPTGGGASWLSPTTPVATTPLLELIEQGWTIANIQMAPVASSACIRLTRLEDTVKPDASHASILGCYFVGGGANGIGIEDNGGCGGVLVAGCRFQALGDSALKGLNTAIAVPLAWQIGGQGANGNRFQQNLNDIKMSLSYGAIENNKFMTAGSGATNKVISTTAVAVQGGNNHILLNQFSNTEAEIAPGSGYTGAASDTWMNYVNNQAALAFGQPA